MRLLIFFTFLLASAICSCRSTKQTVTESADSTSVIATVHKDVHSTDEILSLIISSSEMDLSGITVEFFPPDSAHPDARAAPKALRIDNAKTKNETNASKYEQSTMAEKDTSNVSVSRTSALAQSTKSDTKVLPSLDWVVLSVIPIALLLLIITIYLILKKKQ